MRDRVIRRIEPIPKMPAPGGMKKAVMRVAAYARVSSDNEDQSLSLEAQIDYYRKKISENPKWEFVDIYHDDGISGLSMKKRAGFNAMIEDCMAGKIDLVMTKSISRFARNTVDTVTTIRKLKDKGVGVLFEKENIFTLDSKGEFVLTLMSSLAQEESRSISENVSWGHRKRFADGKGSFAYSNFLGYDKGPLKFTVVINEEQAMIVKRVFLLFLAGYTPHRIAAILTEEGIASPMGKDIWRQGTVDRMLKNEKYKGDMLLQKQITVDYLTKKVKKNEGELPQYYVTDDHEPIISRWLFDYVQEIIEKRKDILEFRYSGVGLFNSKIICGKCGNMFGPRPWHSTDKYRNIIWQCRNRVVKGEPKCRTYNLYDKYLHFLIADIAVGLIFNRDLASWVLEQLYEMLTKDRYEVAAEWIRKLKNKTRWQLYSDEEDISIITTSLVIMPEKVLIVSLIDGTKTRRKLRRYKPTKGIV